MDPVRSVSGGRRGPRALGLVLVGLVGLAVGPACDRNIEPYQPGEEARPPDLARIFPEPAGGPPGGAAGAAVDALAAGGETAARAAFPPSRTEGAGAGASAPTAPISGRVELPAGLAPGAPSDAVLFVIARPQGATGGPPLAVLRIPEPRFPVEFEIGPANVMIPTMQFAGPLTLTARLDADGNAMTRGDTDLASRPVESLAPGASGVALVLGAQD